MIFFLAIKIYTYILNRTEVKKKKKVTKVEAMITLLPQLHLPLSLLIVIDSF